MTVTTCNSNDPEVDDQGSVSPVNTPYLDKFIPANHLEKGERLETPDGQIAVAGGGSVPAIHDGWMWDLTVPGNNDHDFYVVAANADVVVHNEGENPPPADDFNQAMSKALEWLEERGFSAEVPTLGRFGTIQGMPIGMQTANGKTGFRVEFDGRSGAHINVWSGKEKGPHFEFDASESTVTKIQSRYGCS